MCTFIKKVKRDGRGYITVVVSLMLVASLLISGTFVELARIRTAKSILHNANQLAANSTLASYNALLQDVYGLFAIQQSDPLLFEMINNYIEAAIFGGNNNDALNAFHIFYGDVKSHNINSGTIQFSKPLSDPDVFRRQIEEYMKIRGPVLIVQSFFNNLKGSERIVEDAQIVTTKLEINEGLGELLEKYREYYLLLEVIDNLVQEISFNTDKYVSGEPKTMFSVISRNLNLIADCFRDAAKALDDWRVLNAQLNALEPTDPNRTSIQTQMNEKRKEYEDELKHISTYFPAMERAIANTKEAVGVFRNKFNKLLELAKEIDTQKASMYEKLKELKKSLDEGKGTPELRESLLTPDPSDGKSVIDRYEALLKHDVATMAEEYGHMGNDYLDKTIKMLDGIEYRHPTTSAHFGGDGKNGNDSLPFGNPGLRNITAYPGFAFDDPNNKVRFYANFRNNDFTHHGNRIQNSVGYGMPLGFQKFATLSNRHKDFYDELKNLAGSSAAMPFVPEDIDSGDGDAEKKQRNVLKALGKIVDEAYKGLINAPNGAMYFDGEVSSDLTLDGDEDDENRFLDNIKKSLKNNIILDVIADPVGTLANAGDYTLMLSYGLYSFSNYSTNKGLNGGGVPAHTGDKAKPEIQTPTGIPLGVRMNYFYQSEWEYLYNGSKYAGANLNAVYKLMFIIRLACNYITVWKVPGVTAIVKSIYAIPFVGFILGELFRALVVVGESLVDISNLRNGYLVPIIKRPAEWNLVGANMVKLIKGTTTNTADGRNRGLSYENYMLIFFVAQAAFSFGGGGIESKYLNNSSGNFEAAARQLATRTSTLIELNMIHYTKNFHTLTNGNIHNKSRSDYQAREKAMTAALNEQDRFWMHNMATSFSITTNAELRMLFLSQPFAQRGVNGVVPPSVIDISVTDFRGY
jgi:hypothetical protein